MTFRGALYSQQHSLHQSQVANPRYKFRIVLRLSKKTKKGDFGNSTPNNINYLRVQKLKIYGFSTVSLALIICFKGHIAGTRWGTQVYQDSIEKDDNGIWRLVDPVFAIRLKRL
jgi:hypothetical protein